MVCAKRRASKRASSPRTRFQSPPATPPAYPRPRPAGTMSRVSMAHCRDNVKGVNCLDLPPLHVNRLKLSKSLRASTPLTPRRQKHHSPPHNHRPHASRMIPPQEASFTAPSSPPTLIPQQEASFTAHTHPVARMFRVCRFSEDLGLTSHHGVRDQKSVEESQPSSQALSKSARNSSGISSALTCRDNVKGVNGSRQILGLDLQGQCQGSQWLSSDPRLRVSMALARPHAATMRSVRVCRFAEVCRFYSLLAKA
jgi:hypothetical protein